MRGIVSTNKTTLEAIDKKINDYMIANIPNYNAVRWGKIKKHPTEEKYVLLINDDERKPLDRLTTNEKTKLLALNVSWFPNK